MSELSARLANWREPGENLRQALAKDGESLGIGAIARAAP